MIRRLLLASLALSAAGDRLAAQRPLNLGFERSSVSYDDRPWGWTLGWSAFAAGEAASFTLDRAVHAEGNRSLRIAVRDSLAGPPTRTITLQVGAGFARRRSLRLTGSVRAPHAGVRAEVALEAWGDRIIVAGDTFSLAGGASPPARGGDWIRFDLAIDVPEDAGVHSVVVSAGAAGQGTAWFDGFALRLDGMPITEAPAEAPPPTPGQLGWLAGRATPLEGVAARADGGGGDARDLEAIARIVGDARIVGLGESTHGTREFFQLKDRIVDHLVRREGFDVFAIEANQLAVRRIDDYVLGGAGTARDAMRVMFRVWNTEEMLALVERLRAHNLANPQRPVRVIGYDMQDHRVPVDTLLAFLADAEPGYADRVRALTAAYVSERGSSTPHLPDSTRAAWAARADTLAAEVRSRRPAWLASARTRDDTVRAEWAVQSAELLRQAAYLNRTLNSPDRDSLMAANLDWALRVLHPGSRAVAWAHDVHVAKGGDAARSFNAGAQMGVHLRRSFGHRYRAFSLLTRVGHYTATRSFTDHAMIAAEGFPAPEGSVEAMLARIPRPPSSAGVVVDLRVDPGARETAWLWRPRPIRHVGYAAYDYDFGLSAVMPLEFDGVILVDRTTPSRLLR